MADMDDSCKRQHSKVDFQDSDARFAVLDILPFANSDEHLKLECQRCSYAYKIKSEQLQILLQTAGLRSPFCSHHVIEEQYEWLVLHT